MLETLKEQVAAVAKEAEHLSICRRKSGNLGIFSPETGYVVAAPSGVAKDVLETEHVCAMDFWDKVVGRAVEVKLSSETIMYLYAYKGRKDIRAIVHTHACYSTTFSIMSKPIMPIVYECAYPGKTGTVSVVPYGGTGTMNLAWRVVKVMKGYGCCLMESYGAVTADEGMDAASLKTQCVGEIAEMYYIALVVGDGAEPHALSVEELRRWTYPKETTL